MRKIGIATAFILTLAFFSACHKSSSSGSSVSAIVNGTSFSRGNCIYDLTQGAYRTLEVFGANYNPSSPSVGVNTFLFPMIQLTIYDFNGPGNYTVTDTFTGTSGGYPTSTVAMASYQTGDTTGSPGVYGTINITAVSPAVTGTFNFTTADSTRVSNGKFTALTH